jgi:hypothetical protein
MRSHDSATQKKYRELLAQQERDGLSRKEVAARAGIKPSTLTWWGSELKRLDRERAEADAARLMPVTIREVAATAGTAPPASPDFYEVVVGGGRVLRVPRGFEAAEVHALVRVLEKAPC